MGPIQIDWSGSAGKGGGYMPVQHDEDALKKVKRTVGWYNHNGGLAQPIIYKEAKAALEAIDPNQALRILGGLKDKGSTIQNPTAWLKKAAQKHLPDLDPKVRKTIAWYNKHGNLVQPIHYEACKGALSAIPTSRALQLLKGLEEKGPSIQDPTRWLSAAASKAADRAAAQGGFDGGAAASWSPGPMGKGGKSKAQPAADEAAEAMMTGLLDAKLVKTMQWYNRNGGLQQPLDLPTLEPLLAQLPTKDALQVLKGLDGKAASIGNPTGWVSGAVARKLQQGAAPDAAPMF